MDKKHLSPKKRNKEDSKQQLLNTVGKILKEEGYPALKINNIAEKAGLNKKLIYNYFGDLEGLLDEYIKTQDFWSNVKGENLSIYNTKDKMEFVKTKLNEQLHFMQQNIQFQHLLLWRLSQEKKELKKLGEAQEANGEILFKHITDPYFAENAKQFRAVMAILISSLYYLNMSNNANVNTFCGIDYSQEDGVNAIKEAMNFIIEQTFAGLKKEK